MTNEATYPSTGAAPPKQAASRLRSAGRLALSSFGMVILVGALDMTVEVYALRMVEPKWGGPADNWWLGFDLFFVTGILTCLPLFLSALLLPASRRKRGLWSDLACGLLLGVLIVAVQPPKRVHIAFSLLAIGAITLGFAILTARRETAHA